MTVFFKRKSFLAKLVAAWLICITVCAEELDVTSLDDSGAGTLRNALSIAQDNDQIFFSSSLSGTILLQSSLPSIGSQINIVGPTSGSVTIDGASSYQIFQVNTNGNVMISNLTLVNNDPTTAGSAVYVTANATLTLNAVTVGHCSSGCQTPIYVNNKGELIANDLLFSSETSSGQDIFFESGSVGFLSCDSATQPTIWVDGSANVFKKGAGTMSLFASSDPTDLTIIVNKGTVFFYGTATEGAIVGLNATLQGGNYLYLTSRGTVAPSTTTGMYETMTLTDDFFQSHNGTLVIQIDPSGDLDQVVVGGNAFINGTLSISPAAGSYISGTTYKILTSTGQVSGQFSHVVSANPRLTFSVTYLPNSILLKIL